MKKILLLLALVPTAFFGQEETPKPKATLSANVNVSEPSVLGLSLELPYAIKKQEETDAKKSKKYVKSSVFNLSYATMYYDGNKNLTGKGFEIQTGSRTYFNEVKHEKFYAESFLSYGNVKFDEPFFDGKYSYWSLIDGNIGYKLKITEGFYVDPSAGFAWKWEVKGKGDVDNKDIDNLIYRFGVKLGFQF